VLQEVLCRTLCVSVLLLCVLSLLDTFPYLPGLGVVLSTYTCRQTGKNRKWQKKDDCSDITPLDRPESCLRMSEGTHEMLSYVDKYVDFIKTVYE
jgi:uncharacterized membrane protein